MPEARALVAHADLAAQKRPEQLAVAGQPVEPGKRRRASADVDGHPSRILSVLPCESSIDVSPLSRPRTGIGNYLRGLLAGLLEAGGGEHEVVAFGPSGPRGRRQDPGGARRPPRSSCACRCSRARTAGERPGAGSAAFPSSASSAGSTSSTSRTGCTRRSAAVSGRRRSTTSFRSATRNGPSGRRRRCTAPSTASLAPCDRDLRDLALLGARGGRGCSAVPEERVAVAYPGIDPRFRAEGDRADLGGPVRARGLDAGAAQEPAVARGGVCRAAAAAARADAGARRARGLGASGRSRPRASGSWATSRTRSSPGSTAARRRSRIRPASRASGSRSSRRSRAACRSWRRHTRRWTRPAATRPCAPIPTTRRRSPARSTRRSRARPGRGPAGLAHAARFTRRALGEAVLAGYESALRD